MASKFSRVARDVERVLSVNPDARKSDKDLLWMYWRHMGLELAPHQIELFKSLPSPETVTRSRRKLQEQGKYLPPESITKERYEQAEMAKQEIINW